jgi:hypothetical protein
MSGPLDCRLFLLVRQETEPGEIARMLVRARCPEAARRAAASKAGKQSKDHWLHLDRSSCTELRIDGTPEVLMVETAQGEP